MKNLFLFSLLMTTLPGSSLFAEPSAAIRKDKTVMIEAHVGFNGAGAGLGIFLPDDSRLDISTSQDDILVFSDSNKVHKLEYQSFTANSFYYALGVNYRTIRESQYYFFYDEDTSYSEIEAVHAHFAIGNEWSFRNFFIGAEWVGFSTPLSWKYTSYYPDTATEMEKEIWDKEAKRTAIRTYMILPNLYIGFAF